MVVASCQLVLRGFTLFCTQAVERGLEDRLYITGVATDRRDGVDQVEDLFESEVVANLAGVLRGGEQRLAGGGDPGATAAEHGVAAVGVLEQLRGNVTLACEEGEELAQPGEKARARSLGGLADGVDLVGVEGLKELAPAGEVAVEGRHADSRASRDLGHRHLSIRIRERGTGGREDLVAVALGVGSPRR